MDNGKIARILKEYAALLEIQGESPFRVRAYQQAARTLEGLPQPIGQLLQEQADLTALPGIGDRIAAHIQEIVTTGTLGAFDQLQKEVPRSLTELLKLETLGPQKVKQLYEHLGITSVAKLQKALADGSLEKIPGFGPKTVARLQRAITDSARYANRLKLAEADQVVEPLLTYMRHAPGVGQVEVAGSLRRRQETIGDIDILVSCDKSQPVMEHFLSYPQRERVERAGKTRATIILHSGLHIDLRIVPKRSYGAALHYFIGSKAHNVAVRALGIERGLRINEYGVFRVAEERQAKGKKATQKRIGGATEEEVFRAVGLEWIPPELREDRGEVQAAQQGTVPELITTHDIYGNLHMHSTWTDGANTIEEMVQACQELGYEYCAITDHSQSTRVAGGLTATDLKRQWEEIEHVRQRVKGITLLRGMEVDILPDGSLDLPDDILQALDIVLVSVHSHLQMPASQMTERLLKALAHPAVDVFAHPTARLLNKRAPIAMDLEAVFQAAKEHQVALEVNAQPDRLDLSDIHVHHARELGVKLIINTDAHSVAGLRMMRYGVDQARRGWLEKTHVVNTLPWPQFRQWLQR